MSILAYPPYVLYFSSYASISKALKFIGSWLKVWVNLFGCHCYILHVSTKNDKKINIALWACLMNQFSRLKMEKKKT